MINESIAMVFLQGQLGAEDDEAAWKRFSR